MLDATPKGTSLFVFTNPRTHNCYSANGVAHVFRRAVERAGILTGDITLHTLRYTALIQMIAAGYDDDTVMAISGHSSTRMLARHTHQTEQRKIGALDAFAPSMGSMWADRESAGWKKIGGRQEARTPDLRVANAALSQLS